MSSEDKEVFKYTPSSGLGSCRYKMKPLSESTEEYDKLISILKELDIKSFFMLVEMTQWILLQSLVNIQKKRD